MKKLLALLLATVMALTMFAGCTKTETPSDGGTTDGGTTTPGGTTEPKEMVYRDMYSTEVSTLNYLITGEQWPQQVAANVIDTMVESRRTRRDHPPALPPLGKPAATASCGLSTSVKASSGMTIRAKRSLR